MKKHKGGWLAFLCALVLLFELVPAPARAANDVVILAINDQIVNPISASTMPIYYNYSYYVPYVVFDRTYMRANAGIQTDLGIVVAANSSTITLYTKKRKLIYDIDAGNCTDSDGNTYPRAVVRGGITYLPLNTVRQYFSADGLSSYQTTLTDYGPLIRITTPSKSLEDADFAEAALLSLPDILRDYYRTQPVTPSPSPSVSPSATPATPSPSPSPSPNPSPSPGVPVDKSGVRVYLAIQFEGAGGLPALLDTFGQARLRTLFLFRPEALAANETLVRRIIGSGHAVGLTVPGTSIEAARAALVEGNRLLGLIAHTSTRTLSLEGGDAAVAADLSAAGWSIWTPNVDSTSTRASAAYSAALLRLIDRKQSVARITLTDSARDGAALPLLVDALREDKYTLRLAVGGDFS